MFPALVSGIRRRMFFTSIAEISRRYDVRVMTQVPTVGFLSCSVDNTYAHVGCHSLDAAGAAMAPKVPPAFLFLDPIDRPGSSDKALKKARSHLTAHQHQRRKIQETEAFGASGPRRRSVKGLAGKEKEESFHQRKIAILQSADLSDPLTAAFRGGSLAFQLYILDDPANTVGRILNGLGTDAISVLVIILISPFSLRRY